MPEQTLIPSPAEDLVEALDELSLVICRTLGEHCLMCRAKGDRPVRDVDADELEAALTRVRQSLRLYRNHQVDGPHPGH